MKASKQSMLVFALLAVCGAGHAAGLPFTGSRFSMALEYELMDLCVEESKNLYKARAIKICACALEKTAEDGWFPDYDTDEDFREDQDGFMRNFWKNMKTCQR
ncbi:MAG: alpha/beta hydrolase [Gammaproteobacteria bacterium]